LLDWNAATAASSYIIQRSTDGLNFTAIGTATGTSYVDASLTNSSTYHYKVRAVNALGESTDTQAVSVVPGGLNCISINFQGGSPTNGTPPSMEVSESAGYVSANHWNTLAGASGAATALVQNQGSSSAASINWASNNLWSTPITEAAGNKRMMKGYLDTNDTSTTSVAVSGLPKGYSRGGYEVYVYVDGHSNATDSKQGRYTLDGSLITVIDAASTEFGGTFTLANNGTGNCIVFSNRTSSGFTLTATPNLQQPGGRAPLNGIQIVGQVASGPPMAATGLLASALSATSVEITWNDLATDEDAYQVEVSPAGANAWTACPQLVAGSTEYVASGLDVGANYDFRVRTLNTGGVSTSATVTKATLTSFQQWKQDNHIALTGADDADPDGDTMTNLEEYAFGTDPQSGASARAIINLPAPPSGILTYTRRKRSLTGLTYSIWHSTDLRMWEHDTGAVEGSPVVAGDLETVPVILSNSLLNQTKLFIQVRAN
jgi:hypothetical protein